MANKRNSRDPILNNIRNLNATTQATDARTYGISKDPNQIIKSSIDLYTDEIKYDSANKDKNVINSRMTRHRLGKRNNISNIENIYDIIKDQDLVNSISMLIGSENIKLVQVLKDYEIIKRCLPQVHKVISTLINNIISPDAMADSAIGVELPSNTTELEREKINSLIAKYSLNDRLKEYIKMYLIASTAYVTVVPFSEIPSMLEKPDSLNESIETLMDRYPVRTLADYSGLSNISLNESYEIEYPNIEQMKESGELNGNTEKMKIDSDMLNEAINEALSNIEIVNGGREYFDRAILNEAIAVARTSTDDADESMMKVINNLNKSRADSSNTSFKVFEELSNDGFVDRKSIDDIRKKVNFRGCHIEELNPGKVIAFKLRDTIIGYFYVEDKYDEVTSSSTKMMSIMDKVHASVYMKADTNYAKRTEDTIVRAIAHKLIQVIDHRFLNDNPADMNLIYEFVRENALYRDKKRVVFFHPNDICEFRRRDGSIMKNCMFYAKLYILTLLSNIITNATRGADRQLYYVKTGLTTDIEGHVNSTIRAIKQNQLRYSDMGTINDIFNIVGSNVDLFMPRSVDGETPIETETISGQNVDMNNEFLQWLMKSIIQSFGVPSAIIDDIENVDFARTLSMSNIDMAKAALEAQNEVCPPLTKLFRNIVRYELPEYAEVDMIKVKLNPPSVIVFEMNSQRLDSISNMSETIASLLMEPEGETLYDKQIRLFKLEYFKANIPTLNWASFEEMKERAIISAKREVLKTKASSDDSGDMSDTGDDTNMY